MPTTKARKRAVNKCMNKIKGRTAKGKKDRIKAHAESRGESVNFINRAISETVEQEGSK